MTDPLKTGDPTRLCPELDWVEYIDRGIDRLIEEAQDEFIASKSFQEGLQAFKKRETLRGLKALKPHSPVPGHSQVPDSNTDEVQTSK